MSEFRDVDPAGFIAQHVLRSIWIWICFLTLLCAIVPVRFTAFKVGLAAGSICVWALALILFREKRFVRVACGSIAGVVLCGFVFLALPERQYDPDGLRDAYIDSLMTYRGTVYVWGGGNRLGIDCSGLVQIALVDACTRRALLTGNPALARAALSLWWHNRSAKALGDGYRAETEQLRAEASLDSADYAAIRRGDLAVLSDGVHVLAYVGSRTWIEADPVSAHVILAKSPRPEDYYFNAPIRIMRWRMLK